MKLNEFKKKTRYIRIDLDDEQLFCNVLIEPTGNDNLYQAMFQFRYFPDDNSGEVVRYNMKTKPMDSRAMQLEIEGLHNADYWLNLIKDCVEPLREKSKRERGENM